MGNRFAFLTFKCRDLGLVVDLNLNGVKTSPPPGKPTRERKVISWDKSHKTIDEMKIGLFRTAGLGNHTP